MEELKIQNTFFAYSKQYPNLSLQELIEYYSIFGGLEDFDLQSGCDLFENIINTYFKNFESLQEKFRYSLDENLQKDIECALKRLSRGDRKRFSIYKDISQPKGRQIYKILFEKGIIKEEKSREMPVKRHKKLKIKKNLRGYKVEHKIHFVNEATRFWFNFIAPNKNHIINKDYDRVLKEIKLHVEKHISLSFELLSQMLILKYFKNHSILSCGSYWSRKSEIDLLVYTKNSHCIVGEVKYKNTKICKSVLNSLQKKALHVGLYPTHYALFSKSGFSNELLNSKDKNLLLFDLDDFKRLLDA